MEKIEIELGKAALLYRGSATYMQEGVRIGNVPDALEYKDVIIAGVGTTVTDLNRLFGRRYVLLKPNPNFATHIPITDTFSTISPIGEIRKEIRDLGADGLVGLVVSEKDVGEGQGPPERSIVFSGQLIVKRK